MSMDYLEDLENAICSGRTYYACAGQGPNQWHIATSLQTLADRAKRAANAKKYPVTIYEVVHNNEAVSTDSFLVVRKMSAVSSRGGEPNLQWILVDTREAAEMLRDVSQGPTPYFGATVHEVIEPDVVETEESSK